MNVIQKISEAVRSALLVFAGMALMVGITNVYAQTANPPTGGDVTPNFTAVDVSGTANVGTLNADVIIDQGDLTVAGSSSLADTSATTFAASSVESSGKVQSSNGRVFTGIFSGVDADIQYSGHSASSPGDIYSTDDLFVDDAIFVGAGGTTRSEFENQVLFYDDIEIAGNVLFAGTAGVNTVNFDGTDLDASSVTATFSNTNFMNPGVVDFNGTVDFTDATVIGLQVGGNDCVTDCTFDTVTVNDWIVSQNRISSTNGRIFTGATDQSDWNFTNVSPSLGTAGNIISTTNLIADQNLFVDNDSHFGGNMTLYSTGTATFNGETTFNENATVTGAILATGADTTWTFTNIDGYELTNLDPNDIVSTNDIFVDNAAFIDGWIMGGRYIITTSPDDGGAPSLGYDNGDIVATDDLGADDSIVASDGHIRTGSPSSSYGNGDIVATDDLVSDDDAWIGDNLYANNVVATTDLIAGDDVFAGANGEIGNIYIVRDSVMADSTSNDTVTVYCNNGDYIMGCTGHLNSSYSNGRFQGADIIGDDGCKAIGNKGSSGTNSNRLLYVEAVCFSPNG